MLSFSCEIHEQDYTVFCIRKLCIAINFLSPFSPPKTAILKRQHRYLYSTVPDNAEKEAQTLFVTEVILLDVQPIPYVCICSLLCIFWFSL